MVRACQGPTTDPFLWDAVFTPEMLSLTQPCVGLTASCLSPGCPTCLVSQCSKPPAWGAGGGHSWEGVLWVREQAREAMRPAVVLCHGGTKPGPFPREDLAAWSLRQNLRRQKVLGSDTGSPPPPQRPCSSSQRDFSKTTHQLGLWAFLRTQLRRICEMKGSCLFPEPQ